MIQNLSNITTYQAGVIQAAVHRNLQQLCDNILDPYGITKSQWLLIGTVYDAGQDGIRISELADTLGTSLPFLTNMVNVLEAKGILKRRTGKDDIRSKYVSVKKTYNPTIKKIERTLRDNLKFSLYRHISVDDFKIYMKVLLELQTVGQETANKSDGTGTR